jgi:hypothetical protein
MRFAAIAVGVFATCDSSDLQAQGLKTEVDRVRAVLVRVGGK